MEHEHIPVLLKETLELLDIRSGFWYIDATFGRGGHTRKILERGGNVLAFDCDSSAIMYGQRHFVRDIEMGNLKLVHENFDKVSETVQAYSSEIREHIRGVLADFGVSSPQLDDAERGFSFQTDAPLDMRMDKRLGVTAKDLVNALGKKELYELLTHYGGEQHARIIVDAILRARSRKPIETTKELAQIIEQTVRRTGHLHPATKTFLALRIVVNDELGSIERMLPQAWQVLTQHGRLVTICFQEEEDRLVKTFLRKKEEIGEAEVLTKKPVVPTPEEVETNPRSRSSKLRVAVKL